MEHPPSPADFQDFSAINFSNDYSLSYPSYEYHNNMSSPRLGFNSLNLSNPTLPYYSSSSANSPSPYIHASPVISSSPSLNFQPGSLNSSATNTCRPFSPSQSISPPLTNLSASELSADSLTGPAPFAISINGTHHSHTGRARAMSSGTGSPSSSYASAGSLTGMGGIGPHRNVKSYAVASINNVREKRRRNNLSISKREDDDDDDEDDEDINPSGVLPSSEVVVAKRREEIRRQRIESEQRRRDELRDGYRKLKEVLPISNQKSSKVSLLDRATTHIRYLELTTNQMAQKVAELEAETARLRQVNETLMLSAAERSRLTFSA